MGEDRYALDAELVPLSVAATVAYFHLTDPRIQVGELDSLLRAVGRAAISLAQVAVIHLRGSEEPARQMNAEELRRLLLEPMLDEARRPDLDRFLIRRGDLRAALVSLREARGPFVSSGS
jgi:hypothetical protein